MDIHNYGTHLVLSGPKDAIMVAYTKDGYIQTQTAQQPFGSKNYVSTHLLLKVGDEAVGQYIPDVVGTVVLDKYGTAHQCLEYPQRGDTYWGNAVNNAHCELDPLDEYTIVYIGDSS